MIDAASLNHDSSTQATRTTVYLYLNRNNDTPILNDGILSLMNKGFGGIYSKSIKYLKNMDLKKTNG
jgi:hypothetical protein